MRMQSAVETQTVSLGLRATQPRLRRQTSSRRERRLLWSILALSLAIQLLVAPYRGFFGDLQVYLGWAAAFDAHPLTVYGLTDANYPPLAIYIFGILELVYRGVGHVVGFSDTQLTLHLHNRFAVLWFLAKVPTIAANVGSSWLIYKLARRATSARWALLATLAYAIAPSMVLDGAAWGQTDGVPMFFVLLAIVAVLAHRPIWAGVLLGLMLMLKPQPIIFIPILLLYLLLTAGWRDTVKVSIAMGAAVLVVCSPFLLPPHPQVLDFYHNTVLSFGLVTANAYNLWYLIDASLMYQTPVIGSLTAGTIGVLLFTPIYGFALVLVWRLRSIASVYMAMALVAVAFFDLTSLQHERYLFQSLAFLLLAGVYYQPFVRHYALASITVFMNMFILCSIAGVYEAKDPRFIPLFLFFAQHPQVAFITAYLNLQLLASAIVSCIIWMRVSRRTRDGSEESPAQIDMVNMT